MSKKEITLPAWDGVSRVKTWKEKKKERRVEKDRLAALSPEERKAEQDVAWADIQRKRYQEDPSSLTRQALSTNPYLAAEFEDWKRRNNTPSQEEVNRLSGARRYNAQIERTVTWNADYDKFVWAELCSLRTARESATGIKWAIDHMFPLRGDLVSGLHTATNWQLIPSNLNSSKLHRFVLTEPDEWIQYLEFEWLPAHAFYSPEFRAWILAGRER